MNTILDTTGESTDLLSNTNEGNETKLSNTETTDLSDMSYNATEGTIWDIPMQIDMNQTFGTDLNFNAIQNVVVNYTSQGPTYNQTGLGNGTMEPQEALSNNLENIANISISNKVNGSLITVGKVNNLLYLPSNSSQDNDIILHTESETTDMPKEKTSTDTLTGDPTESLLTTTNRVTGSLNLSPNTTDNSAQIKIDKILLGTSPELPSNTIKSMPAGISSEKNGYETVDGSDEENRPGTHSKERINNISKIIERPSSLDTVDDVNLSSNWPARSNDSRKELLIDATTSTYIDPSFDNIDNIYSDDVTNRTDTLAVTDYVTEPILTTPEEVFEYSSIGSTITALNEVDDSTDLSSSTLEERVSNVNRTLINAEASLKTFENSTGFSNIDTVLGIHDINESVDVLAIGNDNSEASEKSGTLPSTEKVSLGTTVTSKVPVERIIGNTLDGADVANISSDSSSNTRGNITSAVRRNNNTGADTKEVEIISSDNTETISLDISTENVFVAILPTTHIDNDSLDITSETTTTQNAHDAKDEIVNPTELDSMSNTSGNNTLMHTSDAHFNVTSPEIARNSKSLDLSSNTSNNIFSVKSTDRRHNDSENRTLKTLLEQTSGATLKSVTNENIDSSTGKHTIQDTILGKRVNDTIYMGDELDKSQNVPINKSQNNIAETAPVEPASTTTGNVNNSLNNVTPPTSFEKEDTTHATITKGNITAAPFNRSDDSTSDGSTHKNMSDKSSNITPDILEEEPNTEHYTKHLSKLIKNMTTEIDTILKEVSSKRNQLEAKETTSFITPSDKVKDANNETANSPNTNMNTGKVTGSGCPCIKAKLLGHNTNLSVTLEIEVSFDLV